MCVLSGFTEFFFPAVSGVSAAYRICPLQPMEEDTKATATKRRRMNGMSRDDGSGLSVGISIPTWLASL